MFLIRSTTLKKVVALFMAANNYPPKYTKKIKIETYEKAKSTKKFKTIED